MASSERDIQVTLHSASLHGDELGIQKLVGIDSISQLFTYTIEAEHMPGASIDEDGLMLQPAWLSFRAADGEEIHTIYGMVFRIRELATPEAMSPRLEITLVPRAQATAMREMLDIFMDKTVPEIVEECLTRCGLEAGEHFDLGGLEDNYLTKEFVVQYKETDLAFISRLCEHHGIFFFVDHSTGKDVLTFGDRNTIFPTSERTPELPFRAVETAGGELYEHIQAVHVERKALPKRYTVRDYNYRIPGVDLLASADVHPNGLGEIVEYGAHFKGPDEGQWFANIRAQELVAHSRIFTLHGNPIATCAGQKFLLGEHPSGDVELLVTAVTHTIETIDEARTPRTTITAIPAAVSYRPPRITPKPRVNGIITGIIDAGVKDGYADVDEHGRYRVRFMFDTATRGEGQASRLVRMAQPHAGEGYGMHFPLRPGTEVILSCIDGDPDRPIITGTVPNPSTASPVSAANRDRNLIRTGGGNQIDISDEDGAHRIKMSTPHAGTIFQLGAPNAPEVGAIISTSGNMVSQVAGTVGAMADVASTINDVWGNLTGKDVTSVAGIPDPISGFEAVEKLAKSGVKAVSSLAKTVDSVASFGDNMAKAMKEKRDAQREEIVADILAQQRVTYPDDALKAKVDSGDGQMIEVVETEEQFKNRILLGGFSRFDLGNDGAKSGRGGMGMRGETTPETVPAAAQADVDLGIAGPFEDLLEFGEGAWDAAKEQWKAAEPWIDTAKSAKDAIAEVYEGVSGAKESVEKLFSSQHEAIQKGMAKIAQANATSTAAFARTASRASRRRRRVTVRAPGAHYNLITATDSVVAEGLQAFYGLSHLKSYIYGGTTAMVVSGKVLALHSGVRAEIAAPVTMVTSTHFDLLARKTVKIKSIKSTTLTVGEKLNITSDDDTSAESKKKLFIKSKELLDVDGGDEAKMKAKKWSVEATEGDCLTKTKGDFRLASEGVIELQHDNTRLFIVDETALLESSRGGSFLAGDDVAVSRVNGGSSIEVRKSEVKVDAKSKFDLTASTVTLNGKVLLG